MLITFSRDNIVFLGKDKDGKKKFGRRKKDVTLDPNRLNLKDLKNAYYQKVAEASTSEDIKFMIRLSEEIGYLRTLIKQKGGTLKN